MVENWIWMENLIGVSKDFFNQTGEIVGCPIVKNGQSGALHIKIETDQISGCFLFKGAFRT